MFSGCSGLAKLDLSNFNTNNVTNMSGMFEDCSSLTTLDLSCFNTGNVTDMSWMFCGCLGLSTIYVSNEWSTENVTDSNYMFSGCEKLIGEQGTTFDDSHTDCTYAHIDGGMDAPGYLYLTQNDPNGLHFIDTDSIITDYYTIDGRRIEAPVKGINIVKYSNGTERRVLVK
jgi:surface protein